MSIFTAQIDAAAEREAEAIERLAELTGEAVPRTKLQTLCFQAAEAAERGLPKPQVYKYSRVLAAERWIKICEVFAAGGVVMTIDARFDTRENRQARRARRAPNGFLVPPSWLERSEQMAARLKSLSNYHGGELVAAPLGAALAGVPERTFYRMVRQGKIPSVKLRGAGASRYIRLSELRLFLSNVASVAS
jgi:hypothetical protein